MLRIKDWIKFYTLIPLAGALLAEGAPIQIAVILFIYLNLISYAFVVNNYFDVEIDRLHSKKMEINKNPLASGKVNKKGVLALMSLQLVFALICSLLLDVTGFYLVLLNILLFTAYSASRIRLKERLGWDIITHGLMFGMLPFLAGFYLCQGNLVDIILISLIFFAIGCEALIAHQLTEYSEDIKATTTTVTIIGQPKGLSLLGIFTASSLLVLYQVVIQHQIPLWMATVLACCLMAYPAYSCRGMFFDIGYCTSIE